MSKDDPLAEVLRKLIEQAEPTDTAIRFQMPNGSEHEIHLGKSKEERDDVIAQLMTFLDELS